MKAVNMHWLAPINLSAPATWASPTRRWEWLTEAVAAVKGVFVCPRLPDARLSQPIRRDLGIE